MDGDFNYLHGIERVNGNTRPKDFTSIQKGESTVLVDPEVVQPKNENVNSPGGHYLGVQAILLFIHFQPCQLLAEVIYVQFSTNDESSNCLNHPCYV